MVRGRYDGDHVNSVNEGEQVELLRLGPGGDYVTHVYGTVKRRDESRTPVAVAAIFVVVGAMVLTAFWAGVCVGLAL